MDKNIITLSSLAEDRNQQEIIVSTFDKGCKLRQIIQFMMSLEDRSNKNLDVLFPSFVIKLEI